MSESIDWLDTQTKAQLAARPPERLAPPIASGFSLVLLEHGADRTRVDRILQMLADDPAHTSSPCPRVVRRELSLTDAMQGQFELTCTDSVSVFIGDEVLRNAKASYLDDLFRTLRKSPEFQPVKVQVRSVPADDRGSRFVRQFFGRDVPLPATQIVARKKARIMQHWGGKLGAVVEAEECAS